jgi:hypothetical protein
MYRPLRKALGSLLREFRRCSYTFPPLYHEALRSPSAPKRHPEGMWPAFVAANAGRSGGWEQWDEFPGGDYCGRFFGSGDGLEEFQRLGESVHLVLAEFNSALDAGRDYHGFLESLYDMARSYPTPLLRLKLRVWGHEGLGGPFEGTDLEERVAAAAVWLEDQLARWTAPPEGRGGYPTNPFCETLVHSLFTSAEAAVRLLIDPASALLVGTLLDDLPTLLPPGLHSVEARAEPSGGGQAAEAGARSAVEETPQASQSERGDAPPYQYRLVGDFWDLRYTAGERVEVGHFENLKGLQYYAKLLAEPNRFIEALELMGRADSPAAQERTTFQPSADRETITAVRRSLSEVEQELDEAERSGNSEREAKLKEEQEQLQTYLRDAERPLGRPHAREQARKAVCNALRRARDKLRGAMPLFVQFLERYVLPAGTGFVYRPLPPPPEWVGL